MLSQTLALAWQFHQHEKHSAQQRFLRWIQGILMVFILTLSQTSSNIQAYLTQNLNSLLGADVVISQPQALTHEQLSKLQALSDQIVTTQQLTTTLTHNNHYQRVQLKAVGKDYPLHGQLKVSTTMGGPERSVSFGPSVGEIWLDSRLLASLSVQLGERLAFANQQLTVTRVLQHEPDRLMEGHSVAMRALMHRDDLAQLNLQDARIQYRYLISTQGEAETKAYSTQAIIDWQKAHLPAAQIHHKQGAHPLALFWKRTENFMGLASLILFFMAAIAIEQLTQVQIRKEQHVCAVCMSLGASKNRVFMLSVFKFIFRSVLIMPAVFVVSAALHWLMINEVFAHWLSGAFEGLQWQWNGRVAVNTMLGVSLISCVFQVPVWMSLKGTSAAKLVNNTQGKSVYRATLLATLTVLVGVAVAYSDNGLLTTMVLASLVISIALILLLSWLALTLGEKLTQNVSGLVPFALYMMKQRLVTKSTQILGVGLCAFLLLFTLMLLHDLGDTLSRYQRQHDGNLLVSQASQPQMQDVKRWANQHQATIRQDKPYLYASLIQVNSQPLDAFSTKPSESLATFKRPIRLHWSDVVPSNNRVVDGEWWHAAQSAKAAFKHWQQVSVEQEVMTDLGLNIGDKLTFSILQQHHEFTIQASHVYQPGKGSMTFWVQMPSAAITHIQAPHYTMASLELPPKAFLKLNELWQKHPSLRMVSLNEMTAKFDATLAMVTQVISGFSALILGVAGIVILASIQALESKEKKKNSVIQSFGFTSKTCLQLNVIEWVVTGLIAATGAIVGTYITGLLMYQSQFSMVYQPNAWWLLGTVSLILLCVTTLGVIASRNSLKSSIRELMAES